MCGCKLPLLFNLFRLGGVNTHSYSYHRSHPRSFAVGLLQIADFPESRSLVKILQSANIHTAAPPIGIVSPLYS